MTLSEVLQKTLSPEVMALELAFVRGEKQTLAGVLANRLGLDEDHEMVLKAVRGEIN